MQDLEIFVDVSNKSSFVKVAQERNISPSSVSRAVSNLERKLNLKLFHRTTRRVSLTEAGHAYFYKISPILHDLKAAAESVNDIKGKAMGTIRITSSVTFGNYILLPILHKFMELHAGVKLVYTLSDSIIDLVDKRIDIAVRHGVLSDSSFVATKLMSTGYRIVASPSYLSKHEYPFKPSHIVDHSCLIFNWPSFQNKWKFMSSEEYEEIEVHGRYYMTNGMALRSLALGGAGVALLADWLVNEDIQQGALIDLFPTYQVSAHDFDTSIWLMTPSREYMPLRIRLLMDFIKENLSK